MTPHRWPALALGLALVGAAAVAVWPLQREAEPAGRISGSTTAKPAKLHGWQASWRAPVVEPGPDGFPVVSSVDDPAAPPPLPKVHRHPVAPTAAPLSDSEIWAHYQPTAEELAYRAFKVEQQADKELRNLVKVLDLTEDQQDRIFAALARTSSLYHPSLQAVGANGSPVQGTASAKFDAGPGETLAVSGAADPTPAATVTASDSTTSTAEPSVMAELTPEQADVYERYTSERDAFWVGVVEDIETELNQTP